VRLVPLATLAFATFALGFGELMIAGILPPIAADLMVSIPLAGQLVTVYALTFAVLSPPLAIILRTNAAKQVLIGSLLIVAAANAMAAVARNYPLLVAARVLAAAGSAVATPLALAAIDAVSTDDVRGRAYGIVFTGFSLAATLGVPIGALVAAELGWRWTFACVALLAALAALSIFRAIPRGAPATPTSWIALLRTIGRPTLRRTLTVSVLMFTAQYMAFTYFRPYFERSGSAAVGAVVWLFLLYGVCGIVGTLVGGAAIDRWGTRPALLISIAGCAATLGALPPLSRTLVGSSVAVAFWALTSWAFGPAVNSALDRDAGDVRDVVLALNLTAINAGIAAGSALGGAAIALAGIGSIAPSAGILCVFALAVALTDPQRNPAIFTNDNER
jgi:predicted MFS family arabinose efflux permease